MGKVGKAATIEYVPDAPMSDHLSRYIKALCRSAEVPFDPGMTRGEARAFVLSRRDAYMTRSEGRKVGCPKCGAAPVEECTDDGVSRERNHAERVQLAHFERVAAA